MQYAIFSDTSKEYFPNRITDDHELFYQVKEFTEETQSEAIQNGQRIAFIYESSTDDFDRTVYTYLKTISLS